MSLDKARRKEALAQGLTKVQVGRTRASGVVHMQAEAAI